MRSGSPASAAPARVHPRISDARRGILLRLSARGLVKADSRNLPLSKVVELPLVERWESRGSSLHVRGLVCKDHAMDQSPVPVPDDHRAAGERTSVLLAEYGALRTELERRANIQWNVVALQVSSAGVVASLAISETSYNAVLLLLPLSSYVFGSRYVLHDFHIKLINRYIQDSLSNRLGGNLQWQDWKLQESDTMTVRSSAPAAVRWNVFHPTRLTFEGVALLALIAAALAGVVAYPDTKPAWHVMAGLALMWALGVIALVALHVSFRRAS
jgi:hypothetical protein